MEFSCENIIKAIPKDKYKKLKFGGVPLAKTTGFNLLGQYSSKDPETLYKNCHVAADEQVLAYLIKKAILGMECVLVTNAAIYLDSASCCDKDSNRISWLDLCEFFVIHTSSAGEVLLHKPGGIRYTVLRQAILDNTSGNELTDFLLEMQHAILSAYPELQEKRKKQVQTLILEGQESMHCDAMNEEICSALKNLFSEPEYIEQAITLVATDYARAHTQGQYDQWVESLTGAISDGFRKDLKALWVPVREEFTHALEDKTNSYNLKYLKTIAANLAKDMTAESIYFAGLLCMRLEKWEAVDAIIDNLEEIQSSAPVSNLYVSRYFAANAQMRQVLQQIKEDKGALKKDMLSSFDSMGLTPYHYALIVESPKARTDLLSSKKMWPELPYKQVSAFESIGIYDYLCLAIYKGLPYEDVRQIAIHTSEEASQLNKQLSSQQNREGIEEITQMLGILLMGAAESSGYCDTAEGKENYEQLGERLDNSADRIEDVKAMLQETESELNQCLDEMFYNAEQKVAQWKKSKNPVVQYLLHIYSDPEYLRKVLSADGEWTLYCLDNGFYYMAPAGEIETNRPLEDETEASTDAKPFGDSWFSPEAHINIEILKKEFRILAKQYHPDVFSDSQAEEIFKEISAEQTRIEESLER